jgi:ribonuclease HII
MARASKRFEFERALRAQGCRFVAGVDEAGRGPLAGPVVAAAVIFPSEWCENGFDKRLRELNDSKQLTEPQREEFFAILIALPEVRYTVSLVDAAMIDQINILQATHRAMNDALARLLPQPDHVLVDGNPVKSMTYPNTAIVQGDGKSYSIAAASVIAKVTRDRLMLDFHQQFPAYGFATHKGYGTPEHLTAIAAHGPCPIHRRSFSPFRPTQPQLL